VKACPGCADLIPDGAATCPSCGRSVEPVPAAPSPAPAAPPPAPAEGPEPGPDPAVTRRKAESRVRTLGVLYLAAGCWTLLGQGYALAMLLTGRALQEIEAFREQPPFRGSPEFERFVDMYVEWLQDPVRAAIPYVLALAVGGFYLWSGLRLRALRSRGMAIAAAVSMIVLFPCSGQCCGCCFTVPLGVAALFILTRADTEAVLG